MTNLGLFSLLVGSILPALALCYNHPPPSLRRPAASTTSLHALSSPLPASFRTSRFSLLAKSNGRVRRSPTLLRMSKGSEEPPEDIGKRLEEDFGAAAELAAGAWEGVHGKFSANGGLLEETRVVSEGKFEGGKLAIVAQDDKGNRVSGVSVTSEDSGVSVIPLEGGALSIGPATIEKGTAFSITHLLPFSSSLSDPPAAGASPPLSPPGATLERIVLTHTYNSEGALEGMEMTHEVRQGSLEGAEE
eukprot:CAMPEP_0169429660 /NCGR_PEP_ID=MMETSP1042-20121227/1983_1 /TAXON_ID=464988 /ORGANISM="Hemiselmis andersenii, Strain CCMP1180" /LENGTH=246 /DNA_ID=CAMNT_0009539921 /DNA_START=275 /DNA_END=1012 /DNA_ORIENTATION=+